MSSVLEKTGAYLSAVTIGASLYYIMVTKADPQKYPTPVKDFLNSNQQGAAALKKAAEAGAKSRAKAFVDGALLSSLLLAAVLYANRKTILPGVPTPV